MIKTLYEGEHFGNLNLIDKPIAKRKQSTTFISAETTYLLGINQENLKELYFSRNEKLQLYYFNFLRRLFIFEVLSFNLLKTFNNKLSIIINFLRILMISLYQTLL